jgi:hypothetical protein
MRVACFLVCWLLFAPPATVAGQALPPIARAGLDLLVRQQPDSAIAVWTSQWTAPDDAAKREQLASGLKSLPGLVGTVLGYDSLRVINITPHLWRAYFLIRCARQPVYLELVLYQAGESWNVSTVNLHTDFDRVIPPEFLGAEHPRP